MDPRPVAEPGDVGIGCGDDDDSFLRCSDRGQVSEQLDASVDSRLDDVNAIASCTSRLDRLVPPADCLNRSTTLPHECDHQGTNCGIRLDDQDIGARRWRHTATVPEKDLSRVQGTVPLLGDFPDGQTSINRAAPASVPRNVMIIGEDTPLLGSLRDVLLSDEEVHVTLCGREEDALAELSRRHFKLLLLRLGNRSRCDKLLEFLRLHPSSRLRVVLALSAAEDVSERDVRTVHGVVSPPFDQSFLTGLVANILDAVAELEK